MSAITKIFNEVRKLLKRKNIHNKTELNNRQRKNKQMVTLPIILSLKHSTEELNKSPSSLGLLYTKLNVRLLTF